MANPIDIAVSKAKGMERAMEARRDGLVGVFQTIAGQHGEVASLIDRIKDDVRKRDSLWPRVRAALLAHEQAEIKTVYAVLDHYARQVRGQRRHQHVQGLARAVELGERQVGDQRHRRRELTVHVSTSASIST